MAGDTAQEHALRPQYKDSFHPAQAKEILKQVLEGELKDKTYNPELTSQWCRAIADEIKKRLKELNLPRYKYVVNVAIAEQRGEGIRIGCRCFWDSDTDASAQEVFMNVRAGVRVAVACATHGARAKRWSGVGRAEAHARALPPSATSWRPSGVALLLGDCLLYTSPSPRD